MNYWKLSAFFISGFLASSLFAAPFEADCLKVSRAFEIGGDELALGKDKKEGVLEATKAMPAGYYRLEAEYRTEGIVPLGKFAVDVMETDFKTKLSGYEMYQASSGWSPMFVYFIIDKEEKFIARFGNFQNAADGAKILLRKIKIAKVDIEKGGENWLVNGDWEKGTAGELPTGWQWKKELPAEQYSLVKNTSFRTGKNILRLTSKDKEAAILSSHSMPLPCKGEIVFTAWVRSSASKADLTMHVVCDGWSPRVEGGGQVLETWKELTAKLPVPSDGKKKFFFVRLDANVNGSIEIADAKVIWYPNGKTTEGGVDETSAGWQGAPGRNMIYNPDFELGGTGYFYDYSWPKEYKQYQPVRASRRTLLLNGKGVDGGTCALVQGAILRAYCFPAVTGKTYTFSVDLRAPEGQNSTEAMAYSFDSEWNGVLWKKVTGIPGDKWQRYSWTVKWEKNNIQKRGYFRIDSEKGVLVDRMQVVEGDLKEYEAPPVMLGLVSDRLPYFLRGRDQAKMQLKIVPGVKKEGKASIEVVAKDAWKREVWKKTLEAPLNETTIVPIDLPSDKLGTFHVDLTAKTDGKVGGIGISRYAIIDKPVLQETSPGNLGLFGVCQESFNFPVWLCEDHAKIHTDLGVRLNRFFASVPPDMPLPIPDDFTADLLAKCKPFREAGVDLLPCFDIFPKETSNACANLNMPEQKDLDNFGKYLGAYVTALKPEIKYWEVFNEPNLWRAGSGADKGKPTMYPKKYFEFQKLAFKTIKKIDPNMIVVCNALNNLPQDWIEEWMKLGGGEYMDIFSFHPYAWTNVYPEAVKLRATLAKFGFKKPIVNSEKYYGCNLFYDRAGYEETRRGYYLPYNQELQTAGRSIIHYITNAAERIPYCAFNPGGTIFNIGPENAMLVYDFFSAYNAATRFLVTAGKGEEIEMGPSLTAMIFPVAKEGPLLAIWTPLEKVEASMMLEGEYQAYDIMGNTYSAEERKKGLRVAVDPTYIRYKTGTSVDSIKTALGKADVIGLGEPFKIDMAVTGEKRITAMITSCRNKPLNGTIKLMSVPEGWKTLNMQAEFRDLAPGKRSSVNFDFDTMKVENLGEYPISLMAESGTEFVRKELVIRPIFAKKITDVKADCNLSEWKDAVWIKLDENNLSKDFNPNLKRDGEKDLSARLACGWNAEYFALAAEVSDDIHKPAESERVGWEGDCIQVYFDPLNDASDAATQRTADDVSYTICEIGGKPMAWIDKGAEGNFKGAANKAEGLNDVDVQLSIQRKDGKTIYEMIFPKTKCIPAAKLAESGDIGFSLLVNDNDGKGRKIGLTLSPKGKEPYGNPHEYRDVLLVK